MRETLTTEQFPQRLQRLRERRGISRRVLADFCESSKSAISRYERGERVPDLETAARIADYFGVTLDYLYSGEAGENN